MATRADIAETGKRFPGGPAGVAALVVVLSLAGASGGLIAALGFDRAVALVTGQNDAAPASEGDDADTAGGDTAGAAGHGPAPAGHHDAAATEAMAVIPFNEIIVNISATTASGRTTSRFMKLNIALVFDHRAPGAERVNERRLYMRDSFQDYLRQLNERDLQGSQGLVTVKQELLRRARTITESDAPQDLLVSDLIIQ